MINGYKRWIGNGTWADVTVVWARNNQDGQVWRAGGGQAAGRHGGQWKEWERVDWGLGLWSKGVWRGTGTGRMQRPASVGCWVYRYEGRGAAGASAGVEGCSVARRVALVPGHAWEGASAVHCSYPRHPM